MTALPRALDRFGAELEIAIRRDLGARRRRRRLLRAAVLSAAALAVALGIFAVLPGGGSSVVGPAAAANSWDPTPVRTTRGRNSSRSA